MFNNKSRSLMHILIGNYTVYGPGSHHRYARPTPDGTGRVVEDGMIFSLTADDWLVGGKREVLISLAEKQ
jgi:hypothetical protein